jgi:hypothetical protein
VATVLSERRVATWLANLGDLTPYAVFAHAQEVARLEEEQGLDTDAAVIVLLRSWAACDSVDDVEQVEHAELVGACR